MSLLSPRHLNSFHAAPLAHSLNPSGGTCVPRSAQSSEGTSCSLNGAVMDGWVGVGVAVGSVSPDNSPPMQPLVIAGSGGAGARTSKQRGAVPVLHLSAGSSSSGGAALSNKQRIAASVGITIGGKEQDRERERERGRGAAAAAAAANGGGGGGGGGGGDSPPSPVKFGRPSRRTQAPAPAPALHQSYAAGTSVGAGSYAPGAGAGSSAAGSGAAYGGGSPYTAGQGMGMGPTAVSSLPATCECHSIPPPHMRCAHRTWRVCHQIKY
jgi:hypothetical protein